MTQGEGEPTLPFNPSRPFRPAPTTQHELALQDFVKRGLNRPVDLTRNLAVHTNLSPRNLVTMLQNALVGITVQLQGTSAIFTRLGFRQTINLSFTSAAAGGGVSAPSETKRFLPMSVTVVQCKDYTDAAQTFKDYVGSFQCDWETFIRPTTDKGLGNYAFETDTSIFWTRLTTFVVIECQQDVNIATGSPAPPIDFKKLATDLDQTFIAERGSISTVPKAGISAADIPRIVVGQESVLKFSFQPGAHRVKDLQVKQPGIVMFGGDITPMGEIRLVGLEDGTATITIQVAHVSSLQTVSQEFTVTVVENTRGSE
ncbi:hypothetical protein FPRO05_14258 [Fusarium proliferatum]|uniref:Uncharacterized protein n=1 Tax=Gibberella intermedia TaxID=948311 RepID=A0A365MTE0_GIBIN|nr:hypothetical protein FPRO05_14258 [Fusarium proliferatum]